jgi:hypothetical protein
MRGVCVLLALIHRWSLLSTVFGFFIFIL